MLEHDRAGHLVVELERRQLVALLALVDADLESFTTAVRRERPVLIDANERDRTAVVRRGVQRDLFRLERRALPRTEDLRQRE